MPPPDSDKATELPEPGPDVVSRRIGDELVLVHLGTNHIHALNATGARFWELLTAGRSRSEIELTLQAEYDVAPEDVGASVDRLLEELESEGLVERREAS